MFGYTFYHKHLERAMAAFGTLFNDITIERRDKDGNLVQNMKVPLAYGPRDKFLTRIVENPDGHQSISVTLPRLAFEMTGFTFDSSRKTNTMHCFDKTEGREEVKIAYSSVPYDVSIQLSVMAKYMHDANMILEQIVPWFTPKYVISVKQFPELNILHDIPVTLENVSYEDNYSDDWTTRREIIYTLDFKMQLYFYGPERIKPIITETQIDVLTVPGVDIQDDEELKNIPRIQRVVVEPTSPTATRDDVFGFSEEFFTFTDGKKYNPATGEDEEI